MEVILKEDVAKLGSRGDVVKVAEGYGRNYLLPRKLAIQANESNKAVIAQMKAAAVRRSAKEKAQAEELAKQFEGVSLVFARKSGENDQPAPQFAMSQSHGALITTQLPPATESTCASGRGSRLSLIPTAPALDASWVISAAIHAVPDAYGSVKLSPCPFLIPAPHRAGSAQVDTPRANNPQG